MKKALFIIFWFPILVYSQSLNRPRIFLLKPSDCLSCSIKLNEISKLIKQPFDILLPDSNHIEFETFKSILTKDCKNKLLVNTDLFKKLSSFPSSVFVLDSKDSIMIQLNFQEINRFTPCLLNSVLILNPPPNFGKRNVAFIESDRIKSKNGLLFFLSKNQHELICIDDDSIRRISLANHWNFADSIMQKSKLEEIRLFNKIHLRPQDVFPFYDSKKLNIVNFSISENQISLLYELLELNYQIANLDTQVAISSTLFTVKLINGKIEFIQSLPNFNLKDGYTLIPFDVFDIVESNSALLCSVRKNKNKSESEFRMSLINSNSKGFNFDSAKYFLKIPFYLFKNFDGEFSSTEINSHLVFFNNYPCFYNLISGKSLDIKFPDSMFLKTKITDEEFNAMDVLASFYCYDIRQINKSTYQMLFSFKRKVYLANIYKGILLNFLELPAITPSSLIRFKNENSIWFKNDDDNLLYVYEL
jgi:hypothetical protein